MTEPTCACGQRASHVVADWKGGWILLCRPHWEFWTDERIRIEGPRAQLELAESRADGDDRGTGQWDSRSAMRDHETKWEGP